MQDTSSKIAPANHAKDTRMCNPSRLLSPAALFLSGLCAAWCATAIPVTSLPSDTPATFKPVTDSFDYVKREEMIPMRDGVKLKTFILVPKMDDTAVAAGYIIVFQDVRGKYGSEGDYVMTRPLAGPLNPTSVDHST